MQLYKDVLVANCVTRPLWDAMAFVIWLASFTRSTIRWRDRDYYIRNGELVPVAVSATGN